MPNSIADKTKKKKVKDNKLMLSKKNPITKTIAYKVIHINSAVNNKWIEVFVLIIILKNKIKKKKKKIFIVSTIIFIFIYLTYINFYFYFVIKFT